ncbi:MAG: ABC transporter substrate-binding protein [Proteobacteria bacterium]|nr:ABC transporter substrate-binding protein [Pseudomonadota bacterium]NOG60154.1 ABC transporter substrate-binding protein [Pseudomonadota bacterium]
MRIKYLIYLILLFLVSGCADSNRNSIAFGLNAAPVTLDPRFATDAVSYRITRLIYRSLIDFDEQFQVKPDLASWEQLALDHYRFTLGDEGREFHNDSRLTASDVKATYESVLNPETVSPHRASIEMIESMEVIDEDTLDFKLSRPDPLFPGRLVISILPAKLILEEHDFSRVPIGSGEMKIVEWKDDSRLKLIRLKDNQLIEFITLKDPTVRVLKLLRGEIDLIQGNLSPEVVTWLTERESVRVNKKQGDTFTYLGFNLEDEVTGNELVRRAIAYAIDRDSIIKYVMRNAARKAGAIFPPNHWAGNTELTGYEYDPEKAKTLLKQAGYSIGSPLKISYKTSSDPFRLRLATIIQDQLKTVGIDVDIRSYDWGTFYGDIKAGRFQMYSLSWVGLKMPDVFRYVFHSLSIPPNGANRGRFNNTEVDALIEKAELEPSLIKQAEYYRELQQILFDTLPAIPLWYEDNVVAMRNEIQGYTLSTDGNFDSLKYTVKK